MLNAIVNVADLEIKSGKVIAETDHIAGYTLYTIQHKHKDEIKVMGVHEHEIEIIPSSEGDIIARPEPQFSLGDAVQLKAPLDIAGIVTGVIFSVSGCCEYEIMYESAVGIAKKIVAAPLLDKVGTAAEPGTETGSMIRSAQTRV